MKRLLTRGLLASIAAGTVVISLAAAPTTAARSMTDKVTSGSWGQGLAVVDPTVPANDFTPSDYAAVNLKVTLTDPGLTWDNGPTNVIGGCGAPTCLPDVMTPGVYKFPYVAGAGGVVADVGGHFNLHGTDTRGRQVTISLTVQADTGFANLPPWAVQADQVTSGVWGQGVAVVDPTVPADGATPGAYAAIDLAVTLTDPGLTWDNGPKNVIGGCGAPACLPDVMTPGVYKFPYVADTTDVLIHVGGHFTLHGTDSRGRQLAIVLTVQSDPGFANLPAWATP